MTSIAHATNKGKCLVRLYRTNADVYFIEYLIQCFGLEFISTWDRKLSPGSRDLEGGRTRPTWRRSKQISLTEYVESRSADSLDPAHCEGHKEGAYPVPPDGVRSVIYEEQDFIS